MCLNIYADSEPEEDPKVLTPIRKLGALVNLCNTCAPSRLEDLALRAVAERTQDADFEAHPLPEAVKGKLRTTFHSY